MNKKFLSAILFGALMVTSTGTFVSCKDYDEEIEDLQGQISNLATKSDVEAKLAQLQAAIDAAKAESAANAAKIAALTKCECDVDAMMKKIQDAVDADMKEYADEINALIKQAEELVGEIADFVTSVELLVSKDASNLTSASVMNFFTVTEKANVFEEGLAGAIEFEAGKQTQVAQTPFVVRVSPTNAVLTSDMISLVNSKGENLDEYVDITVAPYTGLLTRAAENNGLWKVSVTLKEYDDDQFEALKETEDGDDILYAVQVNNALSTAEARYITSSYDLSFGTHTDFTAARTLDFDVTDAYGKKINVTGIMNRYDNAGYTELTWAVSTTDEPTPAVAGTEDNTIPATAAEDQRTASSYKAIKAVQGEPITISIAEDMEDKVAGIYVTLDSENAIESAPSELNAWKGYDYKGLNTVVEGTSTTITIDDDTAINDYIGFRVYAVNLDGTLVDPDGRAFYVLVGDVAEEWIGVETTITPTSVATNKSNVVAVTTKKVSNAAKWSFVYDAEDEDFEPFKVVLADADGNELVNFWANAGWTGDVASGFKFEDVKKIYTQPLTDLYKYEDNKKYTATFQLHDTNGFLLTTLKVSMTKVLPTAAPEGLSIKTNQVVDGIYNCYMIPMKNTAAAGADPVYAESWAAKTAKFGSMAMDQIFNFPTDATKANYTIKFATSKYNSDNEAYTDVKAVAGNGKIIVDADLIDNASKHATTATYNYGMISSAVYAAAAEANKPAGDPAYNYVVNVPEINFETVYNCIYNDTYSWAWATREQLHAAYPTDGWMGKTNGVFNKEVPELTLTYGEAFDLTNIDKYIFGKSEWDARYNKMLNPSYEESLSIESATFTSDANSKQEYFAPNVVGGRILSLDKLPESSNPTADVASTLTIKVKDMYGHERTITIPAVVKPRN